VDINEEHERIILPPPPADQAELLAAGGVAAWREPVTILTYAPAEPDEYPMFLERRVYQGSSGRVYPLPFIERIETTPVLREWDAIHLENKWIRLVILPELGGRIHVAYDKSTGYDFFYRNNVIKPALVGLAGPWISGGVEFNWPQHHRPATFLPVDAVIERGNDGSAVAWNSDHDPFARMKGMHGIRLYGDRAIIELDVRLHNRTDDTQTFLWWANVAARSHDSYQSFFPTDVHWVADHARRAITAFPRADRPYYGFDYPAHATAEDPDGDRIDFYRNIKVPTSYMVLSTEDNFFGGYDHERRAGFVHWADRRVAPGKKQWTWGNAPFGHAWDAHLTDNDGPYVELMAGAFTDNQPDFSYLGPGETRTFQQYWYPIAGIGVAHQANLRAAVSLVIGGGDGGGSSSSSAGGGSGAGGSAEIGVAVTSALRSARVELVGSDGTPLAEWTVDVAPEAPFLVRVDGVADARAELVVWDGDTEVIRWRAPEASTAEAPDVATEPPAPDLIASADELYLTGVHLEQYRHPTRSPRPYWREALRRDPGDSRSNIALAAALHRDGDYLAAEAHLLTALDRSTRRNPNPADGEASYRLGLTLVRLGRDGEAYDRFAKAAWDVRWAHAAGLELAFLDAAAGRTAAALGAVATAKRHDSEDNRLLCLEVVLLRRLGREDDAQSLLTTLRDRDPLDQWARALDGAVLTTDSRTLVDVAIDSARAGETDAALELLEAAALLPATSGGNAAPIAHYLRARLLDRAGRRDEARLARAAARSVSARYCFPAGLDSFDALTAAALAEESDARARELLGMWLYDRQRHAEALDNWEAAIALGSTSAAVYRNAAVAAFNGRGDGDQAMGYYRRALEFAPDDARLRFEVDQLAKRLGTPAADRLHWLETRVDLVTERDDLLVEFADLLTLAERPAEAKRLLESRPLQPWEGGEGLAIAAHERACLAASVLAISRDDAELAVELARAALAPPASLGEARHELDSLARVWLGLGNALAAAGAETEARDAWTRAIRDVAGPYGPAERPADTATFAVLEAARRLGDSQTVDWARGSMDAWATRLETTIATIDYFATSLPALLLFIDDPQKRAAADAAQLRTLLAVPVL
jgi:tetratricopeptide (TPR) repeat protein